MLPQLREQRKPLRAVCHSALPHIEHPFLWVVGLGASGHNDQVIRSLAGYEPKFTRAAFLRGLMQVQAGGLGIRYEVLAA